MAFNLLQSGYATLQYEIAEERASALGRLGRRLEAALTALAACPRTANSDRKIRDGLVEQAGYALWLFVVQREACGLRKIDHVIQVYGVPNEVVARMGPLAKPSIHPTKTVGISGSAAANVLKPGSQLNSPLSCVRLTRFHPNLAARG